MREDLILEKVSLCGRTIIVSGCSTGIGMAICDCLSAAGADIIGLYNTTDYRETERIVHNNNQHFFPIQLDLSTATEAEVAGVMGEVGAGRRIFGLVNNAGINLRNMAVEYDMQDWDKVFHVNSKSVFMLSKEIAKINIAQKTKCKIVNIASLLGYQSGYRSSAYTASKHSVVGITKILSNELGQYGMNVNCVVPGYIQTNMTHDFLQNTAISDAYLKRISLCRWGTPNDVVGAVWFLMSGLSDYITGSSIVVDGGYLYN